MADLSRFYQAQKCDYQIALREVKQGRKLSCWMWYIFPQIVGLGTSSMAQYYAIADLAEAEAYIQDELLGKRLIEISESLLFLETDDAYSVFGCPDNLKLKSSMTLFAVASEYDVFQKVLDKFFRGERDERTLELIGKTE